ncbi:unnamed protein product [Penicillium camemberti]|uniref:Str. FM013 n=1 Tax=Penicillium camemberti (strain FM 013) TaxID=1429867 RepID=A0A0G4PQL2_PENC3|nr:unnamed protein product [Penicillium camemberti]
MRYSPLLCLQFLKDEDEHDASLLGLIINGAGNIAIYVDASTTIDALFLLIPDKYAHSWTSFALADPLYTDLLPVGIRLYGMAVPASTAAAASTSPCAHSILSACVSALLLLSSHCLPPVK